MIIDTEIELGQSVKIRELNAKAIVTNILIDREGVQYHCRWFINGEMKSGYLLPEELELETGGVRPS